MAATTETVTWTVDGAEFSGYAAHRGDGPMPAVLICHAWSGLSDFERDRADQLAELGYAGVALDVYGTGVRGSSADENRALMGPLMADRDLLQKRLLAGLQAARELPYVDADRVAVIGFCFGGLCALDVARSGVDVRGVVSFHGLPHPSPLAKVPITAKVLVLHGHDDPMAKPDAMLGLCDELTEAGVDWQLHAYGGTVHAFTNPNANDPAFGTVYNPTAEARSRAAMTGFLAEIF